MPELPEVETIARNLRPMLIGQTITAAQVWWPRTVAEPDAEEFCRRIAGQAIQTTGRRAKFLLLPLSGATLIIHLRMSGDLVIRPAAEPPARHDRVIFYLSGGKSLVFHDPRKFGRIWLNSAPEAVLGALGPEPLDDSFTPEVLYARLRERRRRIKPLLLDQQFLAGLGNIYTDESLHRAGLHPLTLAESITPEQAAALWGAIRAVLTEGIGSQGASIDWVYRGGGFQHAFRVYQRASQPCPACGSEIQRTVVGQRGTYFCPACQRLPS
jgi:formamidopyrimidine-DNA glycosylase